MEKILRKAKGYCHKCLKVVPADAILIDNFVHIRKKCKEHGVHTARHMWDDPDVFNFFLQQRTVTKYESGKAIISLTNRCNMNCPICFARANELEVADFDIKNLDKLQDFKIVFLSGGNQRFVKILERLFQD